RSSLPRPHQCLDNFSKDIAMIYLKSILAGIGAFVVTVTAFSAAVTVLITGYPQIAMRMLPLQRHDLGWGSFYSLDFPSWPVAFPGVVALRLTCTWLVRRGSGRA